MCIDFISRLNSTKVLQSVVWINCSRRVNIIIINFWCRNKTFRIGIQYFTRQRTECKSINLPNLTVLLVLVLISDRVSKMRSYKSCTVCRFIESDYRIKLISCVISSPVWFSFRSKHRLNNFVTAALLPARINLPSIIVKFRRSRHQTVVVCN